MERQPRHNFDEARATGTRETMSDSLAIQTHELSKTYRDGWFGRRRVPALQGVSLSVNRGEIFGLLGPNGAGKTTLIKILLGLVHKSGGQAEMLGRPAGHRATRRKIGYLPEHHRIPHHLTGNTALEYYGGLSNVPLGEIRRLRPKLLEMVGLGRWGKTLVRKYSKGMAQRLGLAQAMLHNPDLLILDEPTDGVDPVGRAEIREVLARLKSEGKTIFLNSHLLQEVELVCDRVAILGRGKLRRMDTVDALRHNTSTDAVITLRADEVACPPAAQRTHRAGSPAGRCRSSAHHGRGPRSRRVGSLDRPLPAGRHQHCGRGPAATVARAGLSRPGAQRRRQREREKRTGG